MKTGRFIDKVKKAALPFLAIGMLFTATVTSYAAPEDPAPVERPAKVETVLVGHGKNEGKQLPKGKEKEDLAKISDDMREQLAELIEDYMKRMPEELRVM